MHARGILAVALALPFVAALAAQRDTSASVSPPVFSHVSARYAHVFWLSASAGAGATVRFTTDGSEPTSSSPVFDVPRLITGRVTIRAKAFVEGRAASSTTTRHLVVEMPRRTTGAELHVVPTTYRNAPAGFREACFGMARWPDVLSRTRSFGSTTGIAALTDEELTACFRLMARRRLQLTIEAGVVNQAVPSGAGLFAIDAPELRRFIRLGAPLSTVFLQEPWTSADGTSLTYADVVRETTVWMTSMRRAFPGIRLILQEAYPFHSADELIRFVRDVNAAAVASGVEALDGFELDHDWNIPTWSVEDVYRINTAVRAERMRFSIIIWPAGGPTLDDCAFGRRIVRQVQELYGPGVARYGQAFVPDIWSIESWSEIPRAILSETDPCTFMAGARQVAGSGEAMGFEARGMDDRHAAVREP